MSSARKTQSGARQNRGRSGPLIRPGYVARGPASRDCGPRASRARSREMNVTRKPARALRTKSGLSLPEPAFFPAPPGAVDFSVSRTRHPIRPWARSVALAWSRIRKFARGVAARSRAFAINLEFSRARHGRCAARRPFGKIHVAYVSRNVAHIFCRVRDMKFAKPRGAGESFPRWRGWAQFRNQPARCRIARASGSVRTDCRRRDS
jgi:hypothetical protein